MSFKSFSSAQTTSTKDKSDDKVKDTAANDQSAPQSDKNSTNSAPSSKS